MKRLAIAVLCLSTFAIASDKQSQGKPGVAGAYWPHTPAVKAARATGRAATWTAKGAWNVLTWPFRPQKPKAQKRADGTGPIQTCAPHHYCPPLPPV